MRIQFGDWRAFIEQPQYRFRNHSWRVWLYRDVNDHEMEVMLRDGTIERCNIGDLRPDNARPTFELDESAAQSLMTELWKYGVRPDNPDAKDAPKLLREVLETQGKHLEDMRSLVFSLSGRNGGRS